MSMTTAYKPVSREDEEEEVSGDVEMSALSEDFDHDRKIMIKVLNVATQSVKSVYVNPDAHVQSLQLMIAEAFDPDAPIERQRLIAAGRVLRPNDTLREHKLVSTEEGVVPTIHLSMRPAETQPTEVPSAEAVNPLASVDALSAALSVEAERHSGDGLRADSTMRAAARVRFLSSLLALYCALNSLTALLDATTPESSKSDDDWGSNGHDERAIIELALNCGGLWVGAAGLRAARYLDLPSADRYDRALRLFALSTLSYEAYYRLVYLPGTVQDDDSKSTSAEVNITDTTSSLDSHRENQDDIYDSRSGEDDLSASASDPQDDEDPDVTRDSQMLSGFVIVMLIGAILLVCVQNSARLRAELRGLSDPAADAPLPFATATIVRSMRDLVP